MAETDKSQVAGEVREPETLSELRQREKQASRDEDARRLAAGEVTREQLWKENTLIPASKTSIDFSKIRVPE